MENFIIIENVNGTELESILMDMANLYSDTDYVNGIQLYRKKGNTSSFLVLFSNSPDFARFNYFVNYIKYPEGFKDHSPFVRGFYKTADINSKDDFITGEWLMVYISKNDREYVNVSFVNEKGANYLYDFGGKIKRLDNSEESFAMITYDINDFNHMIDIIPDKLSGNIEVKPWWKFW